MAFVLQKEIMSLQLMVAEPFFKKMHIYAPLCRLSSASVTQRDKRHNTHPGLSFLRLCLAAIDDSRPTGGKTEGY